jgi:hypothetical protein
MIQMLAKLHVSVSSSGNVKVSLHLVSVQTAENTTTVRLAPHPRRLAKLLLLRLAQLLMHIPQVVFAKRTLIAQLMRPPLCVLTGPLRPGSWVFSQ